MTTTIAMGTECPRSPLLQAFRSVGFGDHADTITSIAQPLAPGPDGLRARIVGSLQG